MILNLVPVRCDSGANLRSCTLGGADDLLFFVRGAGNFAWVWQGFDSTDVWIVRALIEAIEIRCKRFRPQL